MYPTLRFQRRHFFAVSLAAFALCAAAPSDADIYKCVAKNGSPLYQNFPCGIDSLGLLSPTPTVAKTPATGGGQEKQKTDAGTRSAAPAGAGAATAATADKSPNAAQLNVGSSAEVVRAVLGEPEDVVEDELRSGRVATWRYADGTIVQFDHKQRVVAVQR